jgi:hypothetical protein
MGRRRPLRGTKIQISTKEQDVITQILFGRRIRSGRRAGRKTRKRMRK